MAMGEIIAEIVAGVFALIFRTSSIYQATRENFTPNSFHTLIGMPEKRQRAITLSVGIGLCLLALIFLIQGFGFLFSSGK
jgi:hypothetical protein